ncbi:hypothetical protein Q7C36_009148 [Tachysurus vachellii]|uniref:Uncharacterized protein n=1 Tax=Tachysurus vachellii TaxID=175792 RepID=A0AA88SUC1_TACVA|nr:hypothetical protein Q7C36_009148 [Tachysurus vachellii]
MDCRMLLLLHLDDQVCEALIELEAVKQEKQILMQLIQTMNAEARHKKYHVLQGDEAKQRLCECDAATGGGTARGGEQAETAV